MATGWHKQACNSDKCKGKLTWHAGTYCVVCTDPKSKCKTHGIPLTQCSLCNMPPPNAEGRVRVLERGYQWNATVKTDPVFIEDEMMLQWANELLESDEPKLDPNKLYCTFCKAEVDHLTSTTERKAVIRIGQKHYMDEISGKVNIVETVNTRAEDIRACPNCCLLVRKPIEAYKV